MGRTLGVWSSGWGRRSRWNGSGCCWTSLPAWCVPLGQVLTAAVLSEAQEYCWGLVRKACLVCAGSPCCPTRRGREGPSLTLRRGGLVGTRGSGGDSQGTHIALVRGCAVAELRGRCFPELQDSSDPETQLLRGCKAHFVLGSSSGGAMSGSGWKVQGGGTCLRRGGWPWVARGHGGPWRRRRDLGSTGG